MNGPRSEHLEEASSRNMFNDPTITSEEDLAKREYKRCLNKFSIYLYLTLRQRGLFDNPQKSIVEIARDFQVEMLKKNTVERQQHRLVSQLLTVREDPALEEPMDIVEETPLVTETVCSPSEELPDEPQLLQTEREKENLQFMQAMMRLKSFVNSSVAVPLASYQDVLTPIAPLPNPIFGLGTGLSPDSGCDSQNSFTSTGAANKNVPARDIRNIMRGARCNKILSKSVDAVLNRLQTVVSKNDVTIYEELRGSYLDLSLRTLNQLVDCLSREDENNEVRKKCTAFIEGMITNILTFEGMNNRLQMMKYYLLMHLIDNVYLCSDTLDILFERLDEFEMYAKDPQYNYKIPIHTTENSYYIFKMIDALLYYYIYEKRAKDGPSGKTTYEVWMKGWGNYFGDDNDVESASEAEATRNINRWTRQLERCLVSLTDSSPVIAVEVSRLLEIGSLPELM